jgi:ClpP class serine protease
MRPPRVGTHASGRRATSADAPPLAPVAEPAATASTVKGPRQRRHELIRSIEAARNSRVLTYVCSDRPGLAAQLGEDAIRPMYDVVRRLGVGERLDLFLYSRGGPVEVPWRIVSMLREHCKRLGVLIPFRAHSAATLIAIGCDEIVMGPKAELGPIDPALQRREMHEGSVARDEEVRAEDVMSYVAFLKDQAGVSSESVLAEQMRTLSERLSPWTLGKIYRMYSQIRQVAAKVLNARVDPLSPQDLHRIVDALVERVYSHDFAITRNEARALGLPLQAADPGLESAMWSLFEEYEQMLDMRRPVDFDGILGERRDEADVAQTTAVIESAEMSWAYRGLLRVRRIRQAPQELNIKIKVGVTLPPGVTRDSIPREILERLAKQLEVDLPEVARQQTRDQSAVLRVEARLRGGEWQDVTAEGV